MLESLYSILISVLIFFSCICIGRLFLSFFELSSLNNRKTEIFLFSFGIGVILCSALVLIFGLVGLLKWYIFLIIFLPIIIFEAIIIIKEKEYQNLWDSIKSLKEIHPLVLILIIIIPVLRIFSVMLFPDNSGDAYLYHITVPNYYYQIGEISPVRFSFCYNYPLQMEMIYLLGMIFKSEVGGVLINFWVTVLLLTAAFKLCEMLFSRLAGWIAACIIAILPIFHTWVITSHVEAAVAFYLVLALLGIKLGFESNDKKIWLIAGVFAGAMVAIKLFYLIGFLLLFGIVIIASLSKAIKSSSKENSKYWRVIPIIFGIGGFLSYLPWAYKNLLFTYNPFFPFFSGIINTKKDLLRGIWTIQNAHPFPFEFSFKYYLNNIKDVIDQLSATMNYLDILILFTLPIIFIIKLKKKSNIWFWGFCLLCGSWVIQYGLGGQARWFIPIWILFLIGASGIFSDLISRFSTFKKIGLKTIITLLFLCFTYQQILFYMETARYPWLPFSKKHREAYLNEQTNYKNSLIINLMPLKEGKVLVCSIAILSYGRWLKVPFIQEGLEYFKDYSRRNLTLEEAYRDLRNLDVAYILTNLSSIDNYTETFLEQYCEAVFEYQGMTLLELKY